MMNREDMSRYTFEDYVKDFEMDYLGFDGVPDEPGLSLCPGHITGNEIEPEMNDIDEGSL